MSQFQPRQTSTTIFSPPQKSFDRTSKLYISIYNCKLKKKTIKKFQKFHLFYYFISREKVELVQFWPRNCPPTIMIMLENSENMDCLAKFFETILPDEPYTWNIEP